jgi:hypothetical protein
VWSRVWFSALDLNFAEALRLVSERSLKKDCTTLPKCETLKRERKMSLKAKRLEVSSKISWPRHCKALRGRSPIKRVRTGGDSGNTQEHSKAQALFFSLKRVANPLISFLKELW